jgi:hypothetical protein
MIMFYLLCSLVTGACHPEHFSTLAVCEHHHQRFVWEGSKTVPVYPDGPDLECRKSSEEAEK